jgi:hypothetical protein
MGIFLLCLPLSRTYTSTRTVMPTGSEGLTTATVLAGMAVVITRAARGDMAGVEVLQPVRAEDVDRAGVMAAGIYISP